MYLMLKQYTIISFTAWDAGGQFSKCSYLFDLHFIPCYFLSNACSAWEPCLGSSSCGPVLRNLLFGTLLGNLLLGDLA
jgi:hypothetical protein